MCLTSRVASDADKGAIIERFDEFAQLIGCGGDELLVLMVQAKIGCGRMYEITRRELVEGFASVVCARVWVCVHRGELMRKGCRAHRTWRA